MSGRTVTLGFWSLVALVVGNTIGAGVYTTSGFSLGDLGARQWVMLAWAVGGLVALLGALSYAMLARRLTASGGEYMYLTEVIHPLAGFIAGWISLLAGFTGAIAFAASAFETYARAAAPSLAALPTDTLAIGALVFAGALHILRVDLGAKLQTAIVAVMVVALVALCLFAGAGFAAGTWSAPPPAEVAPFSFTALAGSLVWISLSYSGFNAAVYVAGEAKDAERAVPRAMIVATLLIIVLYLALNAVFLYAPAPSAIVGQPEVAAIAAQALGGAWLSVLMNALIALSLLTSVTAMVQAGPRVYARMARDGAMPTLFGLKEGAPPRAAIALQVVLAVIATLITGLQGLLSYLGFTLSLSLAFAVSSLFVLHLRDGERPASPWYPIAPAAFVAATVVFAALSAWRQPSQLLAALATVAAGSLVYAATRSWRAAARERTNPTSLGA